MYRYILKSHLHVEFLYKHLYITYLHISDNVTHIITHIVRTK